MYIRRIIKIGTFYSRQSHRFRCEFSWSRTVTFPPLHIDVR